MIEDIPSKPTRKQPAGVPPVKPSRRQKKKDPDKKPPSVEPVVEVPAAPAHQETTAEEIESLIDGKINNAYILFIIIINLGSNTFCQLYQIRVSGVQQI